jgi:hypothetical protein
MAASILHHIFRTPRRNQILVRCLIICSDYSSNIL